jgi:hypothetical protein
VKTLTCPYCLSECPSGSLVCATCSRDMVVPARLIAERDDLLRQRDLIRDELRKARGEIEAIRTKR